MGGRHSIPIIDIFAGPGGLGEGFSRFTSAGRRAFRTALSIERESAAHRTLTLRAFYRQFAADGRSLPAAYADLARGQINAASLYDLFPQHARAAHEEAWLAELGSANFPLHAVRERIRQALGRQRDWVLLGGPPCQAYSLVGRSRNRGIRGYRLEQDHRATLYVEYLQILADFAPSVFVMENVKGMLSAKLDGQNVFERILSDLADPAVALAREGRPSPLCDRRLRYRLYPIVQPEGRLFANEGTPADARDFVVRAERYGIPQARHRVIIVGVRDDFSSRGPAPLTPCEPMVAVQDVLKGLPKLRSGFSREPDSAAAWAKAIAAVSDAKWLRELSRRGLHEVCARIADVSDNAERLSRRPRMANGHAPVAVAHPGLTEWYETDCLPCVANHESRSHMRSNLSRYLFAAAFAANPDWNICGRPHRTISVQRSRRAA